MLGLTTWGSSQRSSEHQRHGPGRPHLLARASRRGRRMWLGARHSRWLGGRHRRSMTPTQWALLGGLVPAVGLVLARRRLRLPPIVSLALVSLAPLAAAAGTPRRWWRYTVVGGTYMWSFATTWALPYDDPEKLKRRLHIDWPIRADSMIGLGVPPSQRLQRALRDPPRVTALDRVATLLYGTWFLPHAMLAILMMREQKDVPRAAGRLAAAYHLTTPFYYLVPSAPPWYASEKEGLMDGEVQRVIPQVLNSFLSKPREWPEGNPWGAMPSDHVASAAITAMGLTELGPLYGALGWSYVAGASFAVVYLGEHYVIDVLVGLAIAEAIRRGEATVTPVVLRVVDLLDRLAS